MPISQISAAASTNRRSDFRLPTARVALARQIANARRMRQACRGPGNGVGNRGSRGSNSSRVATEPVGAVVVTVILVLVPGVTDGGLNVAAAPGGSPATVKVTGFGNTPPTGAVEIPNTADCPGAVVSVGVVLATLKFTIVNVDVVDVPPPGAGLDVATEALSAFEMSLPGTMAVSCVELTKVVVSANPFHSTIVPGTKLVPVRVSVKAAPPPITEDGDSDPSVGTGSLIVNVNVPEVPPPGARLKTVIEIVPPFTRSAAGTVAVNWVLLTNIVASAAPFHLTTVPLTKLLPVTVSAKAPESAVAEMGVTIPRAGIGFVPLIVNVRVLEVPPPGTGLNTVTRAIPPLATSLLGTIAVKCAPSTNVVVSTPPFHRTTVPFTKLLPVSASVNPAEPAAAEVGDSNPNVGTGLSIVNVCGLEVPPPGAGLNIVMDAVPAVAISLLGIVTLTWVALTKVVASATPFQSTTVPLTKLLPVSVRMNAGPPAIAEFADKDPNVGAGFVALIVNVCGLEVPPPGVGLNTVTEAEPTAEMFAAGTAAVTWVTLTIVVTSATPFHFTTEVLTNPVPVNVNVNAGEPAAAEFGARVASVGTGALMVNTSGLVVPPAGVGLKTVTEAVPALVRSLVGTTAVK